MCPRAQYYLYPKSRPQIRAKKAPENSALILTFWVEGVWLGVAAAGEGSLAPVEGRSYELVWVIKVVSFLLQA